MSKLDRLIKDAKFSLAHEKIDTSIFDYLNKISFKWEELKQIGPYNFLTGLYLANNDCSIEEAEKKINKIRHPIDVILTMPEEMTVEFLNSFDTYDLELKEQTGHFYNIDEYINNPLLDIPEYLNLKVFLNRIKEHTSAKEANELLDYLRTNLGRDSIYIIVIINAANNINLGIDENMYDNQSRTFKRKINNYNKNEVNSKIKAFLKCSITRNLINWFNGVKAQKQTEIKRKKKEITSQIISLENLEKDLQNKTLTLEKLKSYKISEEIYYYALIELIKIKDKTFQQHYQELKTLEKNPISQLETLFDKYNFNFSLFTLNQQNYLSHNISYNDLETNLKVISSNILKSLTIDENIFYALLLLDNNSLTILQNLLECEIITPDFIFNNPDKLTKEIIEHIYTIFKNNRQLNYTSINAYDNTLISQLNPDLLRVLYAYGINLNIPHITHYAFLENPSLLDIIDMFIEIGLTKEIQNTPNLILEDSKKIIKRIIILNKLQENYLTKNHTLSPKVRKGVEFYLSDNDLDNYVYENYLNHIDTNIYFTLQSNDNITILEELPKSLKFIEEYKTSEYTYQIGTKIFSRLKVLRCLNTLINEGYTNYNDLLFNSLIYNYPNYLSPEDLEELKNLTNNNLKKQLS